MRNVLIAVVVVTFLATCNLAHNSHNIVCAQETPPPLPSPGAPAIGGFGGPVNDGVTPAPPFVPPTGTPAPATPPAFPRVPAPTTPPVITPPATSSNNVPSISIPTTPLPTTTVPSTTMPPRPSALSSPSPTSPSSPTSMPNISLTPGVDLATPRVPSKIVGEPTSAILQQRPELARSVADPQHPFFGLVGSPRTTDTRIEGTPLTLYTVLQSTRQPLRRLQRITAYWDATESLANYHLRCAFETQLQLWTESLKKSPSRSVETESMLALLVPAKQLAASERRAAEVRFIKQQHRFADILSGGEPTDALPIPCDFPLVKPYDTKLDAIARQRGVSQRARELDAQLPTEHLLLGHCRDATVAAEEMFRIVYERQSSLMDALVALRQVMSARQELVSQTVTYNKMIAEYVTETVSSDASPYRLLSALVELPPLE